jgi:tetratricopeptide (TPR) repeat protein
VGKASRRKRSTHEGKGVKQAVFEEKAVPSLLSGRYGFAIAFFLITLTAILIYSNTFQGPFLFDDRIYILENPSIRHLENFLDVSGTRYVGFLSFALNYYFGGLNVFGYHLVNITIHIMNGLLVWWLIFLTFKTPLVRRGSVSQFRDYIALTAALIFIAHPVQTQAVTYITQRFASLATFFCLLSLVLFIKWRLKKQTHGQGPSTAFYILALFSSVFAMKTKEISFTLPFIIVLYEFTFFNGKAFKERLFYLTPFLLTLSIIPFTIFLPKLGLEESTHDIADILRAQQVRELATISTHDYLVTQFRVIVTYIRLLILPASQSVDYDYAIYNSFFNPEILLSFFFLLLVFGFALFLFIRSHKTGNFYGLLASFGILWFFITLSVESSIFPIKDVIFEHRLYLPSVGAVTAFSTFVFYGKERLGIKVPALVFTCILLFVTAVPFSFAAYNRNLVWKDAVALWHDAVKKSPGSYLAHNNLGSAYDKHGLIDEAVEEYKEALMINPDYEKAHYNLGSAYARLGRIEEAIGEYKSALNIDPYYAEAYYNLGLAYAEQGRVDEAIGEYKSALALTPEYADIHYSLGLAYQQSGRTEQAVEAYKKALALEPDLEDAHNNLGLAYARLGRIEEAIEEYREGLRLKPDYAMAHNNLGLAYAEQGRVDEAIEEYKSALALTPESADIHYNLGLAYQQSGRTEQAVEAYKKALALEPDLEDAYNNLGVAYGELGRIDEAFRTYGEAIRLNPYNAKPHFNLGKTYSRLGRFDEAIEELKEALKLNPYDARARYYLGIAYKEKGLKTRAMEELEKALEIKPDYEKARKALESIKG